MIHYQWLLFDADDTLFDYQRAEGIVLGQAFQRAGVAYTPQDVSAYRGINQQLWKAVERGEVKPDAVRVRRFEQLFEAMGVDAPADRFSQTYIECLAACTLLVDGAAQVLRALRGKYRLGIVTNGLRDVQYSRLARSPIHPYIEAMIISEKVGWAKPAREFFDAAFAHLGNPARETVLIIGDSLTSDMAGGAAYGLDTCWFNPARGPNTSQIRITYEIGRLVELVDLLA